MDKSGYTDMTSIQILVFFALVIIIAVYVTVTNNRRKQNLIIKKLKNGWGKPSQRKYSGEDYECISHYFKRNEDENSIDDITWNDLGMDAVFCMMNNTNSSAGQEYLYKMLRCPNADIQSLKKLDKLASDFDKNAAKRLDIQKIFVWIGRAKHISISDYCDVVVGLEKKSNVLHYVSMLFILAAVIFTCTISPVLGIWLCIAAIAFSIITYYKYKAAVDRYFICVNHIVKLLMGAKKITALNIDFLGEYNDKLKNISEELSDITKRSWLLETGNVDGSIAEILLDYLRMLTHVDLIKFNNLIKLFNDKEEYIYELIDTLGFIEASISVASFRCMLGSWCVPEFRKDNDMQLEVRNVYHPLITKPVANSINTKHNVLLTGSNASGKSTFLKTIAINALLSQTIYTSVSEYYRAPVYRIYSSMALRDDLSSSNSYYIVEIKSLKRMLDAASKEGHPVLMFVDEVLRGTNTVERIAASSEILKSIRTDKALVFAATHDVELTSLLRGKYDNYHFQEEVTDDEVVFDFKLYTGPATTRNAIKLLKTIGYDSTIINAQIDELIEIVNLTNVADKKIGGFSGGMKQRVLLAQALLGDPKILILDEPTAGLDPKERINIRNYIAELSKDKIILFATHVVSDIECIADCVLLLKKGEIIAQGTPIELIEAMSGKVGEIKCCIDEVEMLQNKYKIGNIRQRKEGLALRIVGDELPEEAVITDSDIDLEDVYLYYFE